MALSASLELRPLITAIGVELQKEGIGAEQGRHHEHAAVAVLNIGAMHDGVHQEALRVDENMPLLAFDLLARIVRGALIGAVSLVGLASTGVAQAAITDLGTTSPINSPPFINIPGVTAPLTFAPTPATSIWEVTNPDFGTLFPDQNPATIATGIQSLFSLSSAPTLTLNNESPGGSPFSESVPGGYNFVAIHNAQAEVIFDYAMTQTSFSLSGDFQGLSNVRFFSGSAVPEPATWAMMLLGFVGLGFAAFRLNGKNRLEGMAA